MVYLNSHRAPVKSIRFLPPNLELERKNPINIVRYPEEEFVHGNQFMSLGADGQVLVWDLKFESHRDRKNETIPIEGNFNCYLLIWILMSVYYTFEWKFS